MCRYLTMDHHHGGSSWDPRPSRRLRRREILRLRHDLLLRRPALGPGGGGRGLLRLGCGGALLRLRGSLGRLGRDGLGGCGLNWPALGASFLAASESCRAGEAKHGEGAAALALDRPPGRLGSIGITTLTPLFCLGLNRFGPWALERGGATSKEGRPAPLAPRPSQVDSEVLF